ncbi:hypothetical protein PoB_006108800 [Plakobranchus ocellatus]|uniref:Uncharacterized protein n=1 Tax=Plakobranchus ocellatus TaxID=259542 RepID=A0AAV4CRR6_9GAST|nr:hypothetical protein PoB_006108800 [Plakobranchus ocellatus]
MKGNPLVSLVRNYTKSVKTKSSFCSDISNMLDLYWRRRWLAVTDVKDSVAGALLYPTTSKAESTLEAAGHVSNYTCLETPYLVSLVRSTPNQLRVSSCRSIGAMLCTSILQPGLTSASMELLLLPFSFLL